MRVNIILLCIVVYVYNVLLLVVSYVYNVWFGKERRRLSFSVVQRIRIVIAIVP